MSARDELATVIHRRICEDSLSECLEDGGYCVKAALEIVAAGYVKPRIIESVADLNELGRMATVIDAHGSAWVNDGDHAQPWASFAEDPQGGPIWADGGEVHLPATVLHAP